MVLDPATGCKGEKRLPPLSRTVGENIRAQRKNLGISQAQLAQRLGTTGNTVSRWETGFYQPSLDDLERIASTFAISVLDLLAPSRLTPAQERLLQEVAGLAETELGELIRYAQFKKSTSDSTKHA